MKAILAGFCLSITTLGMAETKIQEWDIDKLKAEGRKQGWTFEVGRSWVTDYLEKGGDLAHITGAVPPKNWSKAANFLNLKPRSDLPAHFDWRQYSSAGLQPVRNQSSCGSCWAFAVTAVVESLIKLEDPTAAPDLAEQTLVSRCSSAGDCSGGWYGAFDFVRSPGLPDEAQDPYKAYNSSCRSGLESVASIVDWHYVGNSSSSYPTTEQLKAAIYEYGPVAVTVNGSFGSYSGGVYNRCNTGSINHMVVLEGWDDESETWIMRNSWGENWGEGGYMRIKWKNSRGQRCNNIGQHAAVAVLTDSFRQQLRRENHQ